MAHAGSLCSPQRDEIMIFSDTIKGPLRQLFFVVLLPDGTVVEPSVAERL
jgi:hypothetical protein